MSGWSRTGWPRALAIAATTIGLTFQVGCPLTGTEFRDQALPAVQSGVTEIVNGLLDGLFAVVEPDTTTS